MLSQMWLQIGTTEIIYPFNCIDIFSAQLFLNKPERGHDLHFGPTQWQNKPLFII